jgi:hypothetical protein
MLSPTDFSRQIPRRQPVAIVSGVSQIRRCIGVIVLTECSDQSNKIVASIALRVDGNDVPEKMNAGPMPRVDLRGRVQNERDQMCTSASA